MLKPLRVHGHVVSVEVQQGLLEKMRERPFKAEDLEAEAVRLGVCKFSEVYREPVAMRAVYRILRKERQAGRIKYVHQRWVWVEEGAFGHPSLANF